MEDITFRSTKIRTLENSIVQIPNATVSSVAIVNLSEIKNRRFKMDLELVFDTKTKKLETFKNEIISILNQNENVVKDTINVHFNNIMTNGLNLEILFYFNISDYCDFLDLKEEVNKSIIDLLNKNNISLAYDTKTVEIKK